MRIPKLIKLISECWQEAEKSTCFLLTTRYHDKDEPFITDLFHGELGVAVKEASDKGRVRWAFMEDIRNAFPELGHSVEKLLGQACSIAISVPEATVLSL